MNFEDDQEYATSFSQRPANGGDVFPQRTAVGGDAPSPGPSRILAARPPSLPEMRPANAGGAMTTGSATFGQMKPLAGGPSIPAQSINMVDPRAGAAAPRQSSIPTGSPSITTPREGGALSDFIARHSAPAQQGHVQQGGQQQGGQQRGGGEPDEAGEAEAGAGEAAEAGAGAGAATGAEAGEAAAALFL